MIKKFPIIRPSITLREIWQAIFVNWDIGAENFVLDIAKQTRRKLVFLADSGLTAFYLALVALKYSSQRREVVLPAYTAGSLVVAVKKAGLKPVLVDISLEDFNLDCRLLGGVISNNTLAVVAVHMFGIPVHDSASLKTMIPPEVCFIEDCCQAQGSRVHDLAAGTFGQVSFFSFNRGKNFSILGGGAIATDSGALADLIGKTLRQGQECSVLQEFQRCAKMFLSVMATNPNIYGLANSLVSRFKENAPPDDFTVKQLSGLASALGTILLPKAGDCFAARNRNGEYLRQGLKLVPGMRLPEIKPDIYPVYNRFPVLFENEQALEEKQRQLWKAGFESSRMYLNPLHKMFQLGYLPQDFPNANYFAGHVLTLPVYPDLKDKELSIMIEILRS
jgi:dTDP-4-amino-4,6-dideoxygalactose transaminase